MKFELVFMLGEKHIATHYFPYVMKTYDIVHLNKKQYSVLWREFVFDERDEAYESKRDYVIIRLQEYNV